MVYYTNNIDLHNELVISNQNNKLTNDAKDMLLDLVKYTIRKYYFSVSNNNLVKNLKIDLIKLYVLNKWKNYNINKNPNSYYYFEQIIKYYINKNNL